MLLHVERIPHDHHERDDRVVKDVTRLFLRRLPSFWRCLPTKSEASASDSRTTCTRCSLWPRVRCLAACRASSPSARSFPASTSTLSLGTILAGAALGFLAVPAVGGSAFVGLLFAINLIGTHVLVSGERPEWATVLTFSSVGLLLGMVAAATAGDSGLVTKEYTSKAKPRRR